MWRWVVVLIFALSMGSVGYCTDYDQVLQNARQLARSGHRSEAAALIEGATGQDRGQFAEWLRGYALVWRDAPSRGIITQFLRVADGFPASEHAPDALLRVGCLLEKVGDDPSPVWRRIVSDYPQSAEVAEALLRLGYRRDKAGDDPEPDWTRLVRDHPNTKEAAEALHGLGHLALRNGDPDLAITNFERSAATSAADPVCAEESKAEAGYAFISRYWKTHDIHSLPRAISALAPLTRASVDRGRATRARLGRGEAFLILGLPERAVYEYRAALDLQPENAYLRGIALFELGYCHCLSQSWGTAAPRLDRFLADVPGATLAEKDHNWKQARPDFTRLAVQDPARANGLTGVELVPEAAYWKAVTLLNLKRASEAKALADSIATTFPGLRIATRLEKLRADCAAAIREGK